MSLIDVSEPLDAIAPRPTDRALFVGQTGSGKTTLADVLLRTREYVVVVDVKGTINWRGYRLVRRFDNLLKIKADAAPRLIYRPPYAELSHTDTLNLFFRWVFARGHTTVYIDEVAGITRGDVYPYWFGACLMRGRELGVETWMSTQRPMRVPMICMSEAEHVYAFRLKMEQDRARIESMTGIESERIQALPKRHFLYSPQDAEIQGPLTLDFSRRNAA